MKVVIDILRAILAKLGGSAIDPSIVKNLQRAADNSDKMVALLEELVNPAVDDITLAGSVDSPVAQ